MQRRAAIPLGLVWLLSVLVMWMLTTAALALLISARTTPAIAGLVGQSALSAALACVVVGGPATAVALRVRRRHPLGPAALSGLAIAALILLFIWSYMAASGTALRDTWGAVTPTLVVAAVQLGLAFLVRGRRGSAPAPEPAVPELGPPEPGTPEPAMSDLGAPEPGTPEPGTPEPGTPEPAAPEPAAPERVTPERVTPERVAPEPAAAEPADPRE